MSARLIIAGPLERPGEDDFSGVAIPFEVTRTPAGTVIRACAELESVAREFALRFAGAETSAEADMWLGGAVASLLGREGLERTDDCGRMLVFRFVGQRESPARIIKAEAIAFDPAAHYENLTSFELELQAASDLPAYVAVEGGKIVSAAVALPSDDDGETAEVGVETAEGFRGRGFATACVSALARELCGRGFEVLYLAQADNPASVSVARGAGFEEHGSILQLICAERG